MKVTYHFCHLFQLKGVGGADEGDPIFTISAALSKGLPVLELRRWDGEGASEKRIELAKLDSVKQTWLVCDLLVDYGESGSFRFALSALDGSVISVVEEGGIDTWRDGMEFVRPKWGIYRSLKGADDLNEEDEVSFADFLIQELSGWPEITKSEPGDVEQPAAVEGSKSEPGKKPNSESEEAPAVEVADPRHSPGG